MFCHKCGTKIDDGAAFCHKCGAKLAKVETKPYSEELSESASITDTDKSILPENSEVIIHSYKREKGATPKIKVYCNGQYIGIVKKDESIVIPITTDSTLEFKYTFIKASILVSAGKCSELKLELSELSGKIRILDLRSGTISLHCPNCKSEDIHPIPESEVKVSGGGYSLGRGCLGRILLGPFGLLCGLCGRGVSSNTTTRLFWLCKSCGNKFRDVKEERAELERFCSIGLLISASITTLGIAFAIVNERVILPNWMYIIGGIIGTVFFFLGLYSDENSN